MRKPYRKKYRLADDVWEKLADDDALIRKVEEESARRIRDGSVKRERSQQLITKAPTILDSIMSGGSDVSPRHKIDAIRTLDGMAANGPEGPPPSDRFLIQINLGSESLIFNKSIRPLEPGEIDPNDSSPDIDTSMVAAIAARGPTEGGGGNNTL